MKFASKLSITAAALMTGLSGLMISGEAGAVPAFARQTGMACNTCHFNSFPILTAFGRSFKSDGFTMTGSQAMIEGEDLSLPDTLNIAMVGKVRANWRKADGDSGQTANVEWPDELGMLVGGRLSSNAGFLFELDAAGGSGVAAGKVYFNVAEMGGGKINAFTYRAGEAGYGLELMNTGALGLQRVMESHNWSANLLLEDNVGGFEDGAGAGVAYTSPSLNVSATLFSGAFDPVETMATYLRPVYFTDVSGWDVGVGAQLFSGTTTIEGNPGHVVDVNKTVIDFQAQGNAGDMPLGIYASYGMAPKSDANSTNEFNPTDGDATAIGLLGQLWVTPKASVMLGGGSVVRGDNAGNEDTDTYTIIGAKFKPAQNITFELYNESHTASNSAAGSTDATDSLLRLMLFAGY